MADLYMISGITGALSRCGLAEGTNAGTIQLAAPNGAGTDFVINGVAYHKADTDNIALTAAAAQGLLTTCLYLIQINAAGTVSSKKGDGVLNTDITRIAAQWPAPDADNCPLGGIKVTTTVAANFTAGTTDLSASDVLADYFNFALGMPDKPETSLAT